MIRTSSSHSTISLCISESNLDKRTVTDMGVPLIEGETPVMLSLTRDTQRDGWMAKFPKWILGQFGQWGLQGKNYSSFLKYSTFEGSFLIFWCAKKSFCKWDWIQATFNIHNKILINIKILALNYTFGVKMS